MAMQHDDRLYYMDNLRALAMLAGVLFHAALAYSPLMHDYWPTADAGGSAWVDVLAWFVHLFRMPLFFVIAGFFAALLVRKRGIAGMMRNRLARVLLPFLIFLPLVYCSLMWLTAEAASSTRNISPVLAWIKQISLEQGSLPLAPTVAHLWFLLYLMYFFVLVWVVSAFELKRLPSWLAHLRLWMLVGVAPLLLVPALASVGAPWPAPEFFLPQLWALVFFGVYFALGYALFQRETLLDQLRPLTPFLLVSALAAYAVFLKFLGTSPPGLSLHLLQSSLEAYAGLWMTLCCLQAGKDWLNGRSQVMRYLADASYWVYLVHLPLLFAIQYRLLDVAAGWQMKLGVSVLATSLLALASYQLLVRNTFMGRLLNGRGYAGKRPHSTSRIAA
jgi:peptidoglycan/LPS O-acetylase OafA/YrhL